MAILMPGGIAPKKTQSLTQREIDWLIVGEDVCRKLNLTIACPDCLRAGNRTGAVLRGNNDVGDRSLSVTCDCKHLVFHLKGA